MANDVAIVNYLKLPLMLSRQQPDHNCAYHIEYTVFMHFANWISQKPQQIYN